MWSIRPVWPDPLGKERDDFLFTTDLTMKPAEVLSCFADRWAIEDTFKNTKQLLGGQQPQTWKSQGPERAAALSFWLYSVVWLWYLRQKTNKRNFIVQPYDMDLPVRLNLEINNIPNTSNVNTQEYIVLRFNEGLRKYKYQFFYLQFRRQGIYNIR